MSRVSDPVLRTRKCDARALYCQPATWREFKAGKWKTHQRLTDSSSAITRGTPALRSLNITLKDNESRHLSRLRLDVIIPKLHVQRGVSAERFGRRKVLKSAWRAAIHHSLWLHCIHRGSFVFPRKFEDQDELWYWRWERANQLATSVSLLCFTWLRFTRGINVAPEGSAFQLLKTCLHHFLNG